MVELIGDNCQPSGLMIPEQHNFPTASALSGMIMLSAAKLVFYTGAAWETITSA